MPLDWRHPPALDECCFSISKAGVSLTLVGHSHSLNHLGLLVLSRPFVERCSCKNGDLDMSRYV